jgi:molybdopterin biosynthesis enzyme
VATLAADDLHEDEAGPRLACAAAGSGLRVGERSAGHWPLIATRRGIVDVSVESLTDVNGREGLSVYTLFHGHVVDEGEVVARAKITPFAVPQSLVDGAVESARASGGLVRIRGFRASRIGAIVLSSLSDRNTTAIGRFAESLGEKVRWLGGELVSSSVVEPRRDVVAVSLRSRLAAGADVIVVAGTRAMDELDPTFLALADVGGERVRHGVPAHPGSLFWIARIGAVPVLGLPSCGLFSEATVFDLVLPRLLCGDTIGGRELAALGHGGFLTRDMAFRFPPYRRSRRRGEVAD